MENKSSPTRSIRVYLSISEPPSSALCFELALQTGTWEAPRDVFLSVKQSSDFMINILLRRGDPEIPINLAKQVAHICAQYITYMPEPEPEQGNNIKAFIYMAFNILKNDTIDEDGHGICHVYVRNTEAPNSLHFMDELRARSRLTTVVREDEAKCPICYHDMKSPAHQKVARLPCMHLFHVHCISPWIHDWEHYTCPMCRYQPVTNSPRLLPLPLNNPSLHQYYSSNENQICCFQVPWFGRLPSHITIF
ncbi:Zinc finger, RING-type [Corchorus capsularis]|uniref:Zinc finger, RING-type n=1 Tax=Corchorus capsularis TaxID=210143 RepID=A0A1R3IFX1_COCAP|nr:Zinc finger, RING-type [Corchorus capsularis]